MKTFTDRKNDKWEISLTLGAIKKVQDQTNIDLLNIESDECNTLSEFTANPFKLAEVLSVLLEDQLTAAGVEGVLDRMDGETLCRAQEAFYAELTDFFVGMGRAERAKMVMKHQQMITRAIEMVGAKVEAIDTDEELSGLLSGDSPDTSA